MKTRIAVLLAALCSFGVFAQDNSLFDLHKIPTYSFYTLQFSGQDFLSYTRQLITAQHVDNRNFRINLGLDFSSNVQSPKYEGSFRGYTTYHYELNKRIEQYWSGSYMPTSYDKEIKTENSNSAVFLRALNNFYFNDEKGLFLYGNFGGRYNYYTPVDKGDRQIALAGGAGYGRIVGVRNIVQAYIISRETGAELDNASLQKLSEVIEKHDNDYYKKYRDSSEIVYYNDINEITKKPEQAKKVEQILSSSLYRTVERMTGYRVKAGFDYNNNGVDDQKPMNLSGATVSAEYALPIGFNNQFYAKLLYSKNFDVESVSAPRLEGEIRFSMDHSLTWSTQLDASVRSYFPKDEMERTSLSLSLTTNFAIINSLTLYGSVSYNKYNVYDGLDLISNRYFFYYLNKNEDTDAHLGFRYYIL